MIVTDNDSDRLSLKNQMAIDYCQGVKDDYTNYTKRLYRMTVQDDDSVLVDLSAENTQLKIQPSESDRGEVYIRAALVEKLQKINNQLLLQKKTLIVLSGWRSFEQQKKVRALHSAHLVKIYPDKTHNQIEAILSHFIAFETKSMHITGGAVDALIFDNQTEKVLDFGANNGCDFDLNVECYPDHPNISVEARINRKLLIGLFEREGFAVDPKTFWHFDYGNAAWAVAKNRDVAIFGPIFI
jgi:D-alanyl-D-alanine dipeptidase